MRLIRAISSYLVTFDIATCNLPRHLCVNPLTASAMIGSTTSTPEPDFGVNRRIRCICRLQRQQRAITARRFRRVYGSGTIRPLQVDIYELALPALAICTLLLPSKDHRYQSPDYPTQRMYMHTLTTHMSSSSSSCGTRFPCPFSFSMWMSSCPDIAIACRPVSDASKNSRRRFLPSSNAC